MRPRPAVPTKPLLAGLGRNLFPWGGFMKWWIPPNGMVAVEHPIKMNDLGLPVFRKRPNYLRIWVKVKVHAVSQAFRTRPGKIYIWMKLGKPTTTEGHIHGMGSCYWCQRWPAWQWDMISTSSTVCLYGGLNIAMLDRQWLDHHIISFHTSYSFLFISLYILEGSWRVMTHMTPPLPIFIFGGGPGPGRQVRMWRVRLLRREEAPPEEAAERRRSTVSYPSSGRRDGGDGGMGDLPSQG